MTKQSDLTTLLNDIETKLNYRTSSKLVLSKTVTLRKSQDLNEKSINETLMSSQGDMISTKKVYSVSTPMHKSSSKDFEIKQAIEKELEPYISSVKLEIKQLINNFHTEVETTSSNLQRQLRESTEIRDQESFLKNDNKLIHRMKEDFEQKLSECTKQIEKINNRYEQMQQSITESLNRDSGIENNNQNLNNKLTAIEQKITLLEKKNETTERTLEGVQTYFHKMSGSLDSVPEKIQALDDKYFILNRNFESFTSKNEDILIKINNLNDKYSISNEKVTSFEGLLNDMSKKINNFLDEISKSKENMQTLIKQCDKLSISEQKIQNDFSQIHLLQSKHQDLIQEMKEKLIEKTVLSSKQFNHQDNEEHCGIKKQIESMMNDIESLKGDSINYEDNFEKVQENFEKIFSKLREFEKNQEIVNEIIKTMSMSETNIKQTIDKKVSAFSSIEANIIEKMRSNLNEMKEELEKKIEEKNISQCPGKVLKSTIASEMESKVSTIEEIIKEHTKLLLSYNEKFIDKNKYTLDYNQLFQKLSECEKKLIEVFNYFDPKIEEITETIQILSKTNNPAIGSPHQDDYLMGSQFEKSQTQNQDEVIVQSVNNEIEESNAKNINFEKFNTNSQYALLSPMNLNDVKDKFSKHLKKFLLPMKNFESILEIEFDYNSDDFSPNNEDWLENERSAIGNSKANYFLERLCPTSNENYEDFDDL